MSENVQVPDAIRQRLDDLSMHFCAVRAERGASLRTVAAQTGASFVALGRFEAGRNPSLGLLCAVLAWLELPMAWLDSGAGAPQDGHSATETAVHGAEAREDANSSSITAQDLSEPEVSVPGFKRVRPDVCDTSCAWPVCGCGWIAIPNPATGPDTAKEAGR